ncbi:ATP-binding protein [Streptomyces sp. NPDC093261]|uniref:ATP-binding protein n=1 Tax=Streptomyces sp. NPDC093261 TaxID=3366037 RepID=UPI0037FD10D1
MISPLMKQAADDQGTGEQATLRYSTAWADGAARAVDARQALRAFLIRGPHADQAPVPEAMVLDAQLVVRELIANATRHAPGPCGLVLQMVGEELVITVWDTSPQEPVFKRPDPHRVGGHGLHLVRAAGTKVTVTRRAQRKQVTAHLRVTPHRGNSTKDRTVLFSPHSDRTRQTD